MSAETRLLYVRLKQKYFFIFLTTSVKATYHVYYSLQYYAKLPNFIYSSNTTSWRLMRRANNNNNIAVVGSVSKQCVICN